MAYSESIPQAGHKLSRSQADLLNNFTALKTAFEINHEDFNAAGQGKHIHTTYPVQGATPTTAAGENALFSRTSSLTGIPELVYVPQSAGTAVEFTSSTKAVNGWTRLPSGILMKWGQDTAVTAGAASNTTFTFDTGATIPAFSAVYNAQLTLINASPPTNVSDAIYINALTTTNMTVRNLNNGVANILCYYFVIGI